MINLSTESILSLRTAAALLPSGRGGRPVSFNCLLRWILNGAKAPSGETVKLEAVRLGGRWITSREAIQRFADRLTPECSNNPTSGRTLKQRRAAAERAEKELAVLGI